MFVIIETKGATHIAIYVPSEGSEKSLPTIAKMLENNATFIDKGYSEMKVVKPEMSIKLGDSEVFHHDKTGTLLINKDDHIIEESFAIATPQLFLSNHEALNKKCKEIERLRTDLAQTKSQLSFANEKIELYEKKLEQVE